MRLLDPLAARRSFHCLFQHRAGIIEDNVVLLDVGQLQFCPRVYAI
jgi:hypothetical protein